jgi:hypothetical protein
MCHAGSGTEWFEAGDDDSDSGQSGGEGLPGASLSAAEAEPQGRRLHLALLQGLSEADRRNAGWAERGSQGGDVAKADAVRLALSAACEGGGMRSASVTGSGAFLRTFIQASPFPCITEWRAARPFVAVADCVM